MALSAGRSLGSHRTGTGSSTATAFDAQRRRQTSQPKHLQCCFSRIGTDTAASSFDTPNYQLTTVYESMAVAVQEAQPIITISPKSPQTACLAVPNFEMPTRAQLGIAAIAPE